MIYHKNMKNIALIIEYIGTNYSGFQKQKNGLSIAEVIENAIEQATKERVKLIPSGRTDKGVHALGQVANFVSNSNIPADKMAININLYLPFDIQIKKSFEVPLDFNARKNAKQKTYVYKIITGQNMSVFDRNRALFVRGELDENLMKKVCQYIVGTHDFSAFVASGATTKTTTRTIYSCDLYRKENYLVFEIAGNGFLYNMVRILVGTLILVGKNKMSIEQFKTLLDGGNRKNAGKTVSPDGLYLKEVKYLDK